ncbi:MAG: 2'-deoxycytidine 5'-triphosphate deaminase [Patescibacteria group bacterium]
MANGTGILPSQDIKSMIKSGMIVPRKIPDDNIQPASLDLRVAEGEVIRLPGIFMPGMRDVYAFAKEQSEQASLYSIKNGDSEYVLELGVPYLVPVEEKLKLSGSISARANNKSSSGRINLQVRLTCNNHPEYDSVPCGYKGPLYMIVVAKSFPVRIKPGQTLNQLRFSRGTIENCRLAPYQIELEHEKNGLIYDLKSKKIPWKKVKSMSSSIVLTVNLKCNPVAYMANSSNQSCLNYADRNVDPLNFFEPIARSKDGKILLRKGGFYILATNEAFSVGSHLCSEMVAYSTGMGEFRSHFAGFFDPGWGSNPKYGTCGSPAVLEIIPHEDIILKHGDSVCAMELYHMTENPPAIYGDVANNYHLQTGPRLGKQFKFTGLITKKIRSRR